MTVFFVIALVLLLVILIQDVSSRSIWWFLPLLLLGSFIGLRWEFTTLRTVLLNALFIVSLIGLLTVYIRFRFGKLENPFRSYFGLGDFLFLLALTPLLPFRGFIYFFTIGTSVVLLIHLVVSLFRRSATIPYAGYFAIVTAALLLTERMRPAYLNELTDWNG